ncbi:non-ribosomal peptide synthetase [Nonomuraea dietziae]|uniref:non-ribosomal peptide synthetase n=1 Tax=Nonomuraea dietziae TaxID=65515 RepID=UPI0031D0F38A
MASAALMTGEGPVRIGLPLDGWDLAVVDAQGEPVEMGGTGELIIGGVGLARYLDPAKDAEKYAPLPSLGWERAYRSGDLVRAEPEGLVFAGRADEQIKLGGRRIELGEVDAALSALPGVAGAAAAVRGQLLVGYLVTGDDFDLAEARELLHDSLPAALVPRLAVVEELPTRTSGKIDRDALPWPLPGSQPGAGGWPAEQWTAVLGVAPEGPDSDFFTEGGGSLSAARLVSALRARYPEVTVADLYEHSTLGGLTALLERSSPRAATGEARRVRPMPNSASIAQVALMVPWMTVSGLRLTVVVARRWRTCSGRR